MTKLSAKIKEEFFALLPPTIFFFVALHIVAFIHSLMLKGTGISPMTTLSATVAAITTAHLPGNCQAVANAMPPDVRAATCETTRKLARNGHAMSSSQSAQRAMQHFAKRLAR